jgi:glycosidase
MGWRLDVADELSDEFLDELRDSAKQVNEDAVIIGEVWENAADKVAYGQRRRYFQGRQLDSVMNYPLKNAIVAFCQYGDGHFLYDTLTEIYASYPTCVCHRLMNLLGTHDTERILTVLGRDEDDAHEPNYVLAKKRLNEYQRQKGIELLKIAAAIQFTAYGIPSVYYGDEVGLEGYGDPFCRMPFPWSEIDGGYREELLSYYKRLGEIRNSEDALYGGKFYFLDHGESFVAFVREKGDSRIVVIANRGDEMRFSLGNGARYVDLVDGDEYEEYVTVKPNRALILKEVR